MKSQFPHTMVGSVILLGIVIVIPHTECQSVCTDLTNLPHLQNNYTMVGTPLSTVSVSGLMSCLEECKLELLCKAFTFDVVNLDCNLYVLSIPGNTIHNGPLLYSQMKDWSALDGDYGIMKATGTSLVPGYDCFTVQGSRVFYNGTINTTVSGDTCQRWDSQIPHDHYIGESPSHFDTGESMTQLSNYCRVPITDTQPIPWCYTTNPGDRWNVCNVPQCI